MKDYDLKFILWRSLEQMAFFDKVTNRVRKSANFLENVYKIVNDKEDKK